MAPVIWLIVSTYNTQMNVCSVSTTTWPLTVHTPTLCLHYGGLTGTMHHCSYSLKPRPATFSELAAQGRKMSKTKWNAAQCQTTVTAASGRRRDIFSCLCSSLPPSLCSPLLHSPCYRTLHSWFTTVLVHHCQTAWELRGFSVSKMTINPRHKIQIKHIPHD